ncbi:ester cyclase [Agrobacterium tumefaciens]|uniref:ester cyclase n=1 Tax=Agrobacterium tumefaciens TaxID=358 RepID=UPI0009B7B69F
MSLNERDWTKLGESVDSDVIPNGLELGLAGYRGMLEQDVPDIPDRRSETDLLVVQPLQIGNRLKFDCRPAGSFFDARHVVRAWEKPSWVIPSPRGDPEQLRQAQKLGLGQFSPMLVCVAQQQLVRGLLPRYSTVGAACWTSAPIPRQGSRS